MEPETLTFNKDIPLSNNQSSRLVSLMEHQRQTEKLAAEVTQHANVLKQAVAMLMATIIECSGGDTSAPYALTDNGTRLKSE